jgi:lipoprotein NlpD
MLQRSEIAALSPKPEPAPPPAKADAPAAAVAAPAVPAAKAPEDPPADRVDWGWPAGGKVVSNFDGAASKGVGISGKIGDPIYASAAGRVVYSGEGIPAYGKLIIIRHNSTYLSAYGHNSQLLVKEGQTVTKGQKIAELGTSGAKQAVLLFEIRRLGKPVDPMQYLPQR